MGLSGAGVKLTLEMWKRGYLKNINSAIDMGSQELQLKLADFEELLSIYGVPGYKKEKFAALTNWPGFPRCSTKPFYQLLGVENYRCVDMNENHEAIGWDLNIPFEDKSLYNKFDLVTDHGTNEHVYNISEAYRTVHRLCKPQGLIMIIQSVYTGNGYYFFDLSSFEGLAAANSYKILFSSYIVTLKENTPQGSYSQFHLPLSRALLNSLDWGKISSIGIAYVMQKQSDADFKYPYQGRLLAEHQRNHGYELEFSSEPPSRSYVPMRQSLLEITKTKILIDYVFKRVQKSIKRKLRLKA